MPEILSDDGHSLLATLRQPERSQLAKPSGLWSHRTAPLALLAGLEAACLNSREVHENILASLTTDKAVAFCVI